MRRCTYRYHSAAIVDILLRTYRTFPDRSLDTAVVLTETVSRIIVRITAQTTFTYVQDHMNTPEQTYPVAARSYCEWAQLWECQWFA